MIERKLPFKASRIEVKALLDALTGDRDSDTVLMRIVPTRLIVTERTNSEEIISTLECYIVDVFEDDGREGDEVRAELERQKIHLRKYGEHKWKCAVNLAIRNHKVCPPCDCGWQELIGPGGIYHD